MKRPSFDTYQPLTTQAGGARSFAPTACAITFALLILIGSVNVYVDPRGEFDSGNYRPILDQTKTGKLLLLQEEDVQPEALVLGASLANDAWPAEIYDRTGLAAFNHAIGSASYRDMEDVYWEAVKLGKAPQRLYWVMDVKNAAAVPNHEVRTHKGLAALMDLPYEPGPEESLHPIRAVLSTLDWAYVQDTGRSLWYAHVEGYGSTDASDTLGAVKLAKTWFPGPEAGTRLSVPDNPSVGDVTRQAMEEYPRHLREWERIDPDSDQFQINMGSLLRVAEDMAARNGTMHIILAPPHPIMWDEVSQTEAYPAIRNRTLSWLEERCQLGDGIHVHDFMAPASAGLDHTGFLDSSHMTVRAWNHVLDLIHDPYREHDLCSAPAP